MLFIYHIPMNSSIDVLFQICFSIFPSHMAVVRQATTLLYVMFSSYTTFIKHLHLIRSRNNLTRPLLDFNDQMLSLVVGYKNGKRSAMDSSSSRGTHRSQSTFSLCCHRYANHSSSRSDQVLEFQVREIMGHHLLSGRAQQSLM